MPELPEIVNLATQIDTELRGKIIRDVEVRQEKCLNVPVKQFTSLLAGKAVGAATSRGKWVFIKLDPDAYFLLSLGMGGDVRYHAAGEDLPEKYRLVFTFDDASRLSISFWWFGYAHAVEDLRDHKMTMKLGISPLDPALTLDKFKGMLKSRRGSIKTALLDQSFLAGIGNVYVQDILFKAGLHPDRKISSLSDKEIKGLYEAMRGNLAEAVALGGIAPEKDLYGRPGLIPMNWFKVGYREGEPCPVCRATIEKIKAGSTASYICPKCQR